MTSLRDLDREALDELAPFARRVANLDPRTVARIRVRNATATILARLPFRVLVSRSLASAGDGVDVTVAAGELVAWLDGGPEPPARDAEWRSGLPPGRDWRRLDSVPDEVIRPLVRTGALTLKGMTERAADALLDSVVLTVTNEGGGRAEVTLRAVSALTRMGFLPRGTSAHVDVAGRWTRVVAQHGTVYLERPGGLVLG